MVKRKKAVPDENRRKAAPDEDGPKDRGRIGVRVGEEVRKGLEKLAAADGRDLSGYVRWVLTQHVKKHA